MENLKEKDYYREKIIELVEKINNQGTLEYLGESQSLCKPPNWCKM